MRAFLASVLATGAGAAGGDDGMDDEEEEVGAPASVNAIRACVVGDTCVRAGSGQCSAVSMGGWLQCEEHDKENTK